MLDADALCEMWRGPEMFSSPYPGSLLLSAIAIALHTVRSVVGRVWSRVQDVRDVQYRMYSTGCTVQDVYDEQDVQGVQEVQDVQSLFSEY